MWKYIKGSEADFEGAPEWALFRDTYNGKDYFSEGYENGDRFKMVEGDREWEFTQGCSTGTVLAERRKVDELQSRTNDANLQNLIPPKGPVGPMHYGDDCTPCSSEFDTVQRPAHYNQSGIECIDAIAASMSAEEFQAYLKGNVQKYLWRYQHKNGLEDVLKAEWYLNRLVKELSK